MTLDKSVKAGSTVTVAGTVNYQACDDRVCYRPESAPVTWTVVVKCNLEAVEVRPASG